MSHRKSFRRTLDKLYHDRTYSLLSSLGEKRPGPNPKLDRKKINSAIVHLQDIASDILARKLAKKEFKKYAGKKSGKLITSRGRYAKRDELKNWIQNKFPAHKEFVYVFWQKNKCLYVGRTGSGGKRPSAHFTKFWCTPTRVDIYPSKGKSQTPKLECLARHRFEPTRNRIKPSSHKYTAKCPLCVIRKEIHDELRAIFKFHK